MNSDFTTVFREDGNVHIFKAKILDESYLLFQMFNKSKKILSPCFKIKVNIDCPNYIEKNKTTKAISDYYSSTKNINRERLISYYKKFKIYYLCEQLKDI